MQAADLLAVLAPAVQGKGGPPGAAAGKGVGLGLGADPTAADAQGAVADSFAQALAAMMGLTGQLPVAQVATPATETSDAAPVEGEAKTAGVATAFAVTAAAQGQPQADDLVKQTAATAETTVVADTPSESAATTAKPADATAIIPTALAVPDEAKVVAPPPAPVTSKTPPPAAKAEAATAEPLTPPPAPPAEALAKGLSAQPAAAANATPAPAAAPVSSAPTPTPAPAPTDAPPPPPPVEAQAAVLTPPADVQAEAAATVLAPATTTAKAADPAPKADGKVEKLAAKAKLADAPGDAHAARGIGKGLETAPGQLKKTDGDETSLEPPATEAKSAEIETAAAAPDANTAMAVDQSRAQPAALHGADTSKLAAHTVAHLASQIVAKADGKTTRFDVQLDPAGLGKVDVKIEIGRGGEINAALSFDNPQAASEMRARAGELKTALEQAGFDLSKGGLSFDLNGQSGGRQFWDQQPEAPRATWARAAFTDLSMASEPAAVHRMIDAGGVDVTI